MGIDIFIFLEKREADGQWREFEVPKEVITCFLCRGETTRPEGFPMFPVAHAYHDAKIVFLGYEKAEERHQVKMAAIPAGRISMMQNIDIFAEINAELDMWDKLCCACAGNGKVIADVYLGRSRRLFDKLCLSPDYCLVPARGIPDDSALRNPPSNICPATWYTATELLSQDWADFGDREWMGFMKRVGEYAGDRPDDFRVVMWFN